MYPEEKIIKYRTFATISPYHLSLSIAIVDIRFLTGCQKSKNSHEVDRTSTMFIFTRLTAEFVFLNIRQMEAICPCQIMTS